MRPRRVAAVLAPLLLLVGACTDEAATRAPDGPADAAEAGPTTLDPASREAQKAAIEARLDQIDEPPMDAAEVEPGHNVFSEIKPPEPLPAPGRGKTWLDIANALLAKGDAEQAVRAYHRSLAQEGLSEQTLTGLAAAHYRMKRVNHSRMLLERAAEAFPRSVVARNNLGVMYYELRDYQKARAAFLQAMELDRGADAAIARNLELANFAIDRLAGDETPTVEPDYKVVRYGGGRYVLEPVEK